MIQAIFSLDIQSIYSCSKILKLVHKGIEFLPDVNRVNFYFEIRKTHLLNRTFF